MNFAKALALAWNLPLVSRKPPWRGISALPSARIVETDGPPQEIEIPNTALPLLSLLISGGHTELVLSKEWGSYELIGATRDDAVGEAFDKVARMLGPSVPRRPGSLEARGDGACGRARESRISSPPDDP